MLDYFFQFSNNELLVNKKSLDLIMEKKNIDSFFQVLLDYVCI